MLVEVPVLVEDREKEDVEDGEESRDKEQEDEDDGREKHRENEGFSEGCEEEERTEDGGEENEGNKYINKCEGNNTTNNFHLTIVKILHINIGK